MGFRFPSVSLHKKTVTASGGGVGNFARRPSITPTVSETILSNLKLKKKEKQEGHDGPGSLTWVCEPRIFKLTDFGIKRAKVISFTNYEGSSSSF